METVLDSAVPRTEVPVAVTGGNGCTTDLATLEQASAQELVVLFKLLAD